MHDDEQVHHLARTWLRAHGPATPDELVAHLELGTWSGRELYQLLLDDEVGEPTVFPLADGRLCHLHGLLEGVTLTHVVTADERRREEVAVDPDLGPLHILSDDGRNMPLTGGGQLTFTAGSDGSNGLTGPDGWLPDGEVLVARIVDGEVAVTGLGAVPELDETTAERLEATVRSWDLRDGRVLDEVELIIEGRARYPLLLTQPQAPLGALLDAVDLAMTRRGVVPAELADEMDDTSSTDALIEHLREERDLDAPQLAAVLGVQRVVLQLQNELLRSELVAWRDQAEGDPEPVPASPAEALAGLWDAPVEESADSKTQVDREVTRGDLATVLADREAAMALVEDILDDAPFAAACLLAVLDSAAPTTKDRRLRAELAWVRARTLELTADDHAEAERELRRATELDPSHGPATFDLAGYLSDRGQAGAALGLLIGMEGPGVDELVEFLTPFAGAGPMSAGRNEPCPCGSGRKHKACCAVRGGWPLRARMPWLMRKVMTFYTSAAARDTVLDVALSAGMAEEGAAGSYRDTATLNLALFEGGVIADLCDMRGSLLPADELELLRGWSRVRSRSNWWRPTRTAPAACSTCSTESAPLRGRVPGREARGRGRGARVVGDRRGRDRTVPQRGARARPSA